MASPDELLNALRVVADGLPNTNEISEILDLTKTFYRDPNAFRARIFSSRHDHKGRNHLIRVVRDGNLPWAQKVIEMLDTNISYKMEPTEFMGKECFVCYEAFQENEIVYKVPCRGKHVFHKECISKWVKVNSTCPCCRDPIVIEDITGFLNRKSETDKSVLYYAIKLGNLPFVEKLIEKGALVHYNDASPLHLAAGFSHQKMVDYFLSKGAQIEVTDRYGHTPLYYAASYGNEEVIHHLLEKGANCRFNYYNDIQDEGVKTTVLHIAIQEHNIWGIKPSIDHFLKNNISLNELDSYGFSPLYRAVEHHWMDIVKELCDKGATIGLGPFQKHPLRAAIVENEYSIEGCELEDIYTLLLDKMDTQYKESGEKEKYLELLTEVLQKLTTGYPSFVEYEHFFVKELLKRHNLPISRKSFSYFAKKTLQELQEYQHLDTILSTPTFFFECMKAKNKGLIDHFRSLFFVFLLKDEEGNTAAHYVTDCSMAELVIQHKVDFTVKNNKGQTPLHTYFGDYDVSGGVLKFAYEPPKIVKKKVVARVQRRNPPPPVVDSDDDDEVIEPVPVPKKRTSPPVKVGFARLVELFLQQGVDINAKDNLGVTALQLAVHKHYREETILSALLEQGADINDAGSYKAPLQIACESTYKDKSLIAFLLDHGADPAKLKGEHGFVHYIFKNAYFDLLDKVKNVALNEQDSSGYTPLYYLLTNFQSSAYQHIPMLVSKGLDLNIPYDKRIGMRFALTYAVMQRNITLVKTLIQHGANIDTKDYEGNTALHYASRTTRTDIRDFLLEKGAKPDILNDQGEPALYPASEPSEEEEEEEIEVRIQPIGGATQEEADSFFEDVGIDESWGVLENGVLTIQVGLSEDHHGLEIRHNGYRVLRFNGGVEITRPDGSVEFRRSDGTTEIIG